MDCNCLDMQGLAGTATYKLDDIFNKPMSSVAPYIYRALNYNAKGTFWQFSPAIGQFQVLNVLKTYVRVVLNNPNLPDFYDPQKSSDVNMKNILNEVHKKSGVSPDWVKKILNQLYWSTIQNNVESYAILKPRDAVASYIPQSKNIFEQTGETISTLLKSVNDIAQGAGEGASNIGKLLPYIPYVALAFGVGYGIYFLNKFIPKKAENYANR